MKHRLVIAAALALSALGILASVAAAGVEWTKR